MAKQQSFGEKVAKQKAKLAEAGIVIKLVESKKNANGTSWKFNERIVRVPSMDEIDKVK